MSSIHLRRLPGRQSPIVVNPGSWPARPSPMQSRVPVSNDFSGTLTAEHARRVSYRPPWRLSDNRRARISCGPGNSLTSLRDGTATAVHRQPNACDIVAYSASALRNAHGSQGRAEIGRSKAIGAPSCLKVRRAQSVGALSAEEPRAGWRQPIRRTSIAPAAAREHPSSARKTTLLLQARRARIDQPGQARIFLASSASGSARVWQL